LKKIIPLVLVGILVLSGLGASGGTMSENENLISETIVFSQPFVSEEEDYASIESIENVSISEEAEGLAKKYLDDNIVTDKHIIDAQHIALATIERVDVLVSWNFQQIVNLNKIHAFNAINLKAGYPILEIRSPREILNEEEI